MKFFFRFQVYNPDIFVPEFQSLSRLHRRDPIIVIIFL